MFNFICLLLMLLFAGNVCFGEVFNVMIGCMMRVEDNVNNKQGFYVFFSMVFDLLADEPKM